MIFLIFDLMDVIFRCFEGVIFHYFKNSVIIKCMHFLFILMEFYFLLAVEFPPDKLWGICSYYHS